MPARNTIVEPGGDAQGIGPLVLPDGGGDVSQRPIGSRRARRLRRAVVWPDIQAGCRRDLRTGRLDPTHDRQAVDVALQIT